MKKCMSLVLCFGLIVALLFSPASSDAKKKVKLNKKKVTLYVGKKVRLKVKGTKKKVKWKSSKKKVATVSKKGVVKAKKKGKAKITAKVSGKKLTCKVTVKNKRKTEVTRTKTPLTTKAPTVSKKPTNSPQYSPNVPNSGTSDNPGAVSSQSPSSSADPSQPPKGSDAPVQTSKASDAPNHTPKTSDAPVQSPKGTDTPAPTGSTTAAPGTATPASTPFVEQDVKSASFESGTDGFTARGSASLKSQSGGYKGNCLYVSGRTASWHGAGYEAGDQIVPGAKYEISAYVKLESGSTTVKCTYQPESDEYIGITSLAADTTWKEMKATFTAPASFSMFYIYFEIPDDAKASFYLDEINLRQLTAGTGTVEELDSIREACDPVFGKTGTCLTMSQLQNEKTLAYVKKHYSSFTLENEMKPDTVLRNWGKQLISTDTARSRSNDYVIPESYTESQVPDLNYSSVDSALKIAKANGLKMRAHTLVWHSQTPEWFFKEDYDNNGDYVSTDVMDARMEMYIRSVMKHVYTLDNGAYKDVVYAWDVANEYLNNNANANWSKVYGNRSGNLETEPPYLKKAFEIAHDMLSQFSLTESVSLLYNDFNTYVGNHPTQVISLINYINKGEPKKICDGIGMQSHLDIDYPTPDLYVQTVTKFANAGFEVQITELDITINNENGNFKEAGQTDEDQAKYIADLMKKLVAVQNTTHSITGLTLWGLYDGASWRKESHPLLFDTGIYDVKPSYYSFMDALRS